MNTEQNDLVIQEFLSQFELATIEQDTPREEFLSQFELAPKKSADEPECDLNGLEKIELYGATFWVPAPVVDVYREIIAGWYSDQPHTPLDVDTAVAPNIFGYLSYDDSIGQQGCVEPDGYITDRTGM